MGNVFRNNGRRVQGSKVIGRHRIVNVDACMRLQYNSTLITILHLFLIIHLNDLAAWCRGHHADKLVKLSALLKDKGLNLDALSAGKDETNRYGTNIGHGNRIVEDVQLGKQFHYQITIL